MTHIARFTTGNLWRHISVMSLTNAMGLTMVFVVDFIDIMFIAQLGVTELAAGVGFAGSVLFFVRSIGVALGISTSVLVSRQLGQKNRQAAARYALSAPILAVIILALVAFVSWILRHNLLTFIGARGVTLDYASEFLTIVLPGTLVMVLGMCGGQIIRALGEAKLSMWISITAASVNAILDPIFIFVFDWGLSGAAWATVASQMTLMVLTWFYILVKFKLVGRFSWQYLREDYSEVMAIAFPSVLTNMASPLTSAFAARQMASFGDDAVAAFAVIMRLVPVSLAVIFALSGAVAPIVGQNAGAGLFNRVRQALYAAFKFNWLVVFIVSVFLLIIGRFLPALFNLNGDAASLLVFFTTLLPILYGFDGMVFFCNAAFNNLSRPFYSTIANFCRFLFGAVPLIMIGQYFWGAYGILVGYMAESIFVALLSWFVLQRLIAAYENGDITLQRQRLRDTLRVGLHSALGRRWH